MHFWLIFGQGSAAGAGPKAHHVATPCGGAANLSACAPKPGFWLKKGRVGLQEGFKRRGAPVGFIWAEFQLKRSHGDPFRHQNHGSETSFSLVLTNH